MLAGSQHVGRESTGRQGVSRLAGSQHVGMESRGRQGVNR